MSLVMQQTNLVDSLDRLADTYKHLELHLDGKKKKVHISVLHEK